MEILTQVPQFLVVEDVRVDVDIHDGRFDQIGPSLSDEETALIASALLHDGTEGYQAKTKTLPAATPGEMVVAYVTMADEACADLGPSITDEALAEMYSACME